MQPKRIHDRLKIALMAAGGLALVGLIVLMSIQIPAPHRSIEKTLDAKAFLEPKPSVEQPKLQP